jgi:predicted nucleotide-binding protein
MAKSCQRTATQASVTPSAQETWARATGPPAEVVPDARRVLGRDAQFPAQLAHVGNSQREHRRVADVHAAPLSHYIATFIKRDQCEPLRTWDAPASTVPLMAESPMADFWLSISCMSFYHVTIAPTDPQRRRDEAVALDKDADWIREHIVKPRLDGRDIVLDGQSFSSTSGYEVRITTTDIGSDQILSQTRTREGASARQAGLAPSSIARMGLDVTGEFLTDPRRAPTQESPSSATTFVDDRKSVMVIYGHDKQANGALFDWLRSIGLRPREWSPLVTATGTVSPYVGQVLEAAFREAQAVVAFFTPDEYVTAAQSDRDDASGRFQARPNVLVEAGMALIAHPTRTVLVLLGKQELPSDLHGMHYVLLSDTDPAPLHDLANRLSRAGCDTDLTGPDYLNPGRFPNRDIPGRAGGHHGQPDGNDPADAKARPASRSRAADHDASVAEVSVDVRAADQARRPFTHEITVSSRHGYLLAEIAVRVVTTLIEHELTILPREVRSSDLVTTRQGSSCTFWTQLDVPIDGPIVCFVDQYGDRYYHYNGSTQRFRFSSGWAEAIRRFSELMN